MLAGEVQEHANVRVVEAVVHHPTGAACLHDAGCSKQAEGVGDVRLGRTGGCGEVADAELAGLEEGVEQARPRGVAEQTKEAG